MNNIKKPFEQISDDVSKQTAFTPDERLKSEQLSSLLWSVSNRKRHSTIRDYFPVLGIAAAALLILTLIGIDS